MLRCFCRASAGPQTPKGLRRAFYFFDRFFVVLWVDTVGAVGPHPRATLLTAGHPQRGRRKLHRCEALKEKK